ncbi:DUF6049 family protein [Rhodococcus sp. X156]|uniref:DUF6049 family protein n=1 Tax=Rhodococcus sp. X156 TaxID=2499145 RepID=UPI000FD9A946|nr:DUF6049 family protein [Rhodococcus sp. X156]
MAVLAVLLGCVALLGGLSSASAAGREAAAAIEQVPSVPNPQFVSLQVDTISPSTVTTGTLGLVTVTGSVVNDGDRDVRRVQVRLQRGAAIDSSGQLRTALRSSPSELVTQAPYVDLVEVLRPGESAPFSLTLGLTGDLTTSLALTEPGIYPLLVNVNGIPDFGTRARLDEGHFLLPVLSLPPTPGAVPVPPAPAPAPAPTGVTVLWPLADHTRVVATPLGAPARLSSDDLAASFVDGGRLAGLLSALEQGTTPVADPTGAARTSTCLAIDPDLLVTAQTMVRGYEVLDDNGAVRPGTGGAAAAGWLERLTSVAKQRCVMAMPWAQADLNALSRASLDELTTTAVSTGRETVASILGLPSLPNVVWPTDGLLADRTASTLRGLGTTAVLLARDNVSQPGETGAAVDAATVELTAGSTTLSAVLVDPTITTALGATSRDDPARLQDALGALTWPALNRAQAGRAGVSPTAASAAALLTPPQVWEIDEQGARAVLAQVGALTQAGLATPTALPTLLNQAKGSAADGALSYPVQASAAELPATVTSDIAALSAEIRGFRGALVQDAQGGLSPDDLLAPLRLGLLRGAPAADGLTTRERTRVEAQQLGAVRELLGQLHASVSLQAPGGTYTLASAQSPLLLVVRNDLPVAVNVRVRATGPPGVDVTDIGVQELPARSGRQLQVPTSVNRTGQFAIDVSLATDTGQALGEPARLQVQSTAYGPATALATAAAALVLVALVARRLWHRFRGQPDRADEPWVKQ